jgi:site-specific DNA recombinase
MKRRAILYIRVSTDEQADKGYSLGHQEERLRKYCELQEIEVVNLYKDDHSAKTFIRPEFQRMLSFVKKHKNKTDVLLFTKWDRFSRNAGDAYSMINQLNKLGMEPQAIEQPLDLNIPENKIMLAFYLAAPEVENDRRALNTLVGMRRARKEGRWIAPAPKGYKNKRDERDKPIIVINDDAKFVKKSFEEVATKIHSVQDVFIRMKKEGFNCSRTNFWTMLRNPVYMGKVPINAYKEEAAHLVNGIHEPIISQELFYAVQDHLDGKRRNAPFKHTKRQQFPLRGLLICPRCANVMSASVSKGNGGMYEYYHCKNRCKERVKAETVNRRFLDGLLMLSFNPAIIDYYEAEIKNRFKEGVLDKKNLVRNIQQEIDKNQERINNARKLLLDNVIDANDFHDAKKQYQPEIEKLTRKQTEILGMDDDYQKYLAYGFSLLKNLGDYYEKADIEAKQKLIGLIFPEKLIFENNQFRTKKHREAIKLILRDVKGLQRKKNGLAFKKEDQSVLVPETGLEPVQP